MTIQEAFILLAEDNEDDAFLTVRTLKKQRLVNEVVWVKDGAEALDFLFARGSYSERDPGRLPQVVLLDLNLPKVSGLEVLQALRQHEATQLLPVVMLTSSKEESDVLGSYNGRANSYVQKPVSSDAFSEAVRQLGAYWLLLNERVLK
jgi:two-component system, response regulator